MNVRRIMSRHIAMVKPDTPVREIFKIMSKNKFSLVSVVDDDGNLIGVVPESN
ncbi:MAG: CBS domain-containing protein, partial [Candidatus Eremiobacteraeota bacterium]|nr:CBS domain-containing protein [Candidatus Eremiobacteraeota bacterium]